jgi:hypothetical protein
MSRKCVLLTTTDFPLYVFFLYLSQYPTLQQPKVGDTLLLQAETASKKYSEGTNELDNTEIICLSGQYEVTRVIGGTGVDLIPELTDPKLSNDTNGYGVQVRRKRALTTHDRPIRASFVFAGV